MDKYIGPFCYWAGILCMIVGFGNFIEILLTTPYMNFRSYLHLITHVYINGIINEWSLIGEGGLLMGFGLITKAAYTYLNKDS